MSTWLNRTGLASLLLLGWLSTQGPAQAQYPGVGGGLFGAGNPYAAMGAGGVGGNPYSSMGGGSGAPGIFYTGGQGYGGIYGEAGGMLYGASYVIKAYGDAIIAQESARITREQYYQARLDRQRKEFDLRRYIEENTPTYTQVKEKEQKWTLRRIQFQSMPAEISSGKALNLLLDDAAKFPARKSAVPEDLRTPFSIDQLRHLNVKSEGSHGIGLLRDGGKINWPVALADILTEQQRRDITTRAERLVKDAAAGRVDNNNFKDLSTEISTARERLLKKVNDMPTEQYLRAKRFLNDLEGSLSAATDPGVVAAQANFDSFVSAKARTVQDVVDYMITHGLRFAPATQADESAYRALHSALANFSLALNAQFNPEAKEPSQ
jgi:hypothetical protein